jgi:putative methyltransferase (TIGR04325 family)
MGSLLGQRIRFAGRYENWAAARDRAGDGYAAPDILERARVATHALSGAGTQSATPAPAVTVVPPPPFHVLASVLMAASMRGGHLSAIDYGGALGSTYFRCARYLKQLKQVRWTVVEQAGFVACGRREFESTVLRFASTLGECVEHGRPDIVIFSAVLQYLERPLDVLRQAALLQPRVIIIDRTPILRTRSSCVAIQRVPPRLGKAAYPAWLFNEQQLLAAVPGNYALVSAFDALDGVMSYGLRRVEFRGFILENMDGQPDT